MPEGIFNNRKLNNSEIIKQSLRWERHIMEFIHSNMYLLIEKDCALIIDPNNSKQAIIELVKCGVKNVTVLLTHEHLDHTCGLMGLKKIFKTEVLCTKRCSDFISVFKNNRPLALMGLVDRYGRNEVLKVINSIKPFECEADIVFEEYYEFRWSSHSIKAISTPGHSPGGCCYEVDGTCVFTGDVLVPDNPVLSRFPGGSINEYERVTLPYLKSIEGEMSIYPGHGESCKKRELDYYNGWYRKINNNGS